MKIIEVKDLPVDGLKLIRYARFKDNRGYFTEIIRYNEIDEALDLEGQRFDQCNESFSKARTVRGLHFQWNPYMGKLVRLVHGKMIDMALDIRRGSPTFGKMFLRRFWHDNLSEVGEWIWVPPGFAHGCVFLFDSTIEYMCTGSWNPDCEVAISPLAHDIVWEQPLCGMVNTQHVKNIMESSHTMLISDKDKNGFSLEEWTEDKRSFNFVYGEV